MNDNEDERDQTQGRIGIAGWIGIVILVVLLAAALWYAQHAWGQMPAVALSPLGWLFLVLGVITTVVVGAGLMALLFYSSRKGKDF
jgi:sterol desaturase/sphingolipid hydroxylase (fatty acid hydroxylase superfamily)